MPGFSWPLTPSVLSTPASGRRVAFLGKGLFFPLREDPATGDFQRVADEANVAQCMHQGILTLIGERVMNEAFGTIAYDLLFEESDRVADLLAPSIKDYIDRFEPRVILQDVVVRLDSANESLTAFVVRIVYVVRATNKRANLVFPFYLQAQEAA